MAFLIAHELCGPTFTFPPSKHRGGAPIHYALIQGDEEAGVTIMEMVKEMDAGDMISSS